MGGSCRGGGEVESEKGILVLACLSVLEKIVMASGIEKLFRPNNSLERLIRL